MYVKKVLLIINLFFLATSLIVITKITTIEATFGNSYFLFWWTQFDVVAHLWNAGGWSLLVISIFGLISLFKESTVLTYIYGLILSLLITYNIGVALTAFYFTPQSAAFADNRLGFLVREYDYPQNKMALDWIQSTYECCGKNGPSDWSWSHLPRSCFYHEYALFRRGCYSILHRIVLKDLIFTGMSSLIIGIMQILGVLYAVSFGIAIKKDRENSLTFNINKTLNYGSNAKT